jgi:carboxypeptidase C (cathepsin A)
LNELKIDFEGVMIGDGWTDPINQLNHYDSFLYSIGVASKTLRERCTWFQTQCIHNIMLGN